MGREVLPLLYTWGDFFLLAFSFFPCSMFNVWLLSRLMSLFRKWRIRSQLLVLGCRRCIGLLLFIHPCCCGPECGTKVTTKQLLPRSEHYS